MFQGRETEAAETAAVLAVPSAKVMVSPLGSYQMDILCEIQAAFLPITHIMQLPL